MNIDSITCYRALLAHDARFDGQFFTCVKTTGIYCRPICPVRPPKFENCIFVPTTAAAQNAGFRPCLRCRPEYSPEVDELRGTPSVISRALSLIEEGALDEASVGSFAARLGVGERQLRRLFQRHFGANPITVAQTRRLLLAKRLIHETDLPLIEISHASGFLSLRRFNETFLRFFKCPPSAFRQDGLIQSTTSGISLLLSYRAPYDWAAMMAFLAARAIPGIEFVTGDEYKRVIAFQDEIGSIAVSHVPEKSALRATICFPILSLLPTIIMRIRRIFDLGANPLVIADALGRDPLLSRLVEAHPGLRVPGAWDGFEIAVRAILGQQITVAAATRLAGKLVKQLGQPIASDLGVDGLTHAFPRHDCFDRDVIASVGMPLQRAAALSALAEAVLADPQLFEVRRDLVEAVTAFCRLPGVGDWTAQYIAMRALRESDAFPAGDIALQRVLAEDGIRPTAKSLTARAESWRPWRAYAALYLWTADPIGTNKPLKQENHNALMA